VFHSIAFCSVNLNLETHQAYDQAIRRLIL